MLLNLKDAPEQAKRIFGQIQAIFEEKSIAPTPLNYYVWYNYIKGDNPPFRQEMDAALSDPFGYDDRLGIRLYENFLSVEDKNDSQFDRSLKRLIESLVKKMNLWSEKLNSHSEELSQTKSHLSKNDLSQEQLKSLTDNVLNSASSMQSASNDFNEHILSAEAEITKLKKELIEAKEQAMTDELTEVGNRKAFNNTILDLMEKAKDKPNSLSLIIADIDFFKRFNDKFGHLVGDSILRYFTSIIKKNSLANENVFRYGGEEFAILIAGTDKHSVRQRAEEIRHTIENAKLKRKNSTDELGEITASFGVSTYRGEDNSVNDFIDRADQALYLAKQSGRNQVKSEDDL